MVNKKRSSFIQKLVLFVVFQGFFVCVSFLLLKRVGAFGCFDDCFNFGAGDFILQGKQLYSQIFFNHQPFMAYISAAIQYITHPQTLFELVKYHRIAALVFADICGSLLIFRFGFSLFLSLVVFELTKFYIFGDRFLAEGMIAYPMMYLTVLVISFFRKERVFFWEYILAAICSWFIFWMREPFMPWSFIALGILFIAGLREKNNRKSIVIGLSMFLSLHVVTVLLFPVKEYVFNVIVTNLQQEVAVQPWTMQTVLQIVAYPVFVLIKGFGNVFQNVLVVLSGIFFVFVGYELFWKKRYLLIIAVIGILATANLRLVPVGSLYYDAFHMIPWYGMFLCITATGVMDMWRDKKTKNISVLFISMAGFVIGYTIIAPQSYIRESIDTQTEFNNGYGNYFAKGEVIRLLAAPGDTMFVEMWEDPIYFVAGVPTAYKYSWYTSIMPKFPIYQEARQEMFLTYAPTFYVGACRDEEADSFVLLETDKAKYEQLLNSGKPSCVYVMKKRIPTISDYQKNQISLFGYTISKE